jgi:hypothetical protein
MQFISVTSPLGGAMHVIDAIAGASRRRRQSPSPRRAPPSGRVGDGSSRRFGGAAVLFHY